MEGLFAVIVLTLINAVEVVLLLRRFIIPIEVIVIFAILLLALLAILNMKRIVFWRLMLLLFTAQILNVGYLFLKFGQGIILYLCLMLSCIGFGIAVMSSCCLPKKRRRVMAATPEVREEYKSVFEEKPHVKKEFSPGKLVASRVGKQYHKPRCDWAKRINAKNLIWFDTEEEAEKQGYGRHWCLKE